MAILESDYMDFGNGIIGDDTFDIWRKKTNSLKVEIDDLNTSLTSKINTDFGTLPSTYIPIAGSAKQVSTQISFTSTPKFPNATTVANSLDIGGTTLYSAANTLQINHAVTSASTLKGTKLEASSQIKFGTKDYSVPSAPSSLSILQSNVAGQMSWVNPADAFANAGGLQQTTTVFEEIVPVGSIIPWASTEPPTGGKWLVCSGGEFSAAALPDLAAELGDTYGVHNGDTYYLPDFSGRVPVGPGTGAGLNFGDVGNTGGETNTISGFTTLTAAQSGLPSHSHRFQSTVGGNVSLSGDTFGEGTSGNNNDDLSTTAIESNTAQNAVEAHSHTMSPGSRIQPYLTINYIIKAKTDSKIDFKIDLQDSGLIMQDSVGVDGDNITPVNETVKLKINPETTAFRIDNDGKLAFATGTVLVPASLSVTGFDVKLRNETRAGGNSHSGRALVHGNGSNIGDPVLNGYDRKSVTTLNDIGGFGANDTLIINYNNISPNSVGDYTGGVVINGTKAIMFEDGTILNSAQRKGKCKRRCERNAGKLSSPAFSDSFIYINDDDNPVLHGNSNVTEESGAPSCHRMYLNSQHGGHAAGQEHILPNDELAANLYIDQYNAYCLSQTGKIYSTGYGYSTGTVVPIANNQSSKKHFGWQRAGCELDEVVFDRVLANGDPGCHTFMALDSQGYLWGSGVNDQGTLANGTTIGTYNETAANVSALAQKRDSLAYPALGTSRFLVPHVMNPLATALGSLTTDPSLATQFKTTFIDVALAGSYTSTTSVGHWDSIAALGADGRVYTAGYGNQGQIGAGAVVPAQTNWGVVKVSSNVELTNVIKIYSSGEDFYTSFFAVTANGDLYAWGRNEAYELGTGDAINKTYATLVSNNVKEVHTNSSGRGDGWTCNMLLTDHDSPQLFIAGKTAGGESGNGLAVAQTFSTWTRITTGPCNTSLYTIQNLYRSNGIDTNFNFIIAKELATNKLSLWAAGVSGGGQCGILTDIDPIGARSNLTSWTRVDFGSHLLEKVIDIHPARQWPSDGSNTFIYLNDGRVFATGQLRWDTKTGYANGFNFFKFTQLSI